MGRDKTNVIKGEREEKKDTLSQHESPRRTNFENVTPTKTHRMQEKKTKRAENKKKGEEENERKSAKEKRQKWERYHNGVKT